MYHDEEVGAGVGAGAGVVKMNESGIVVHRLHLEEDNYQKAERVEDHSVPENQTKGEKEVKAVGEVDLALEAGQKQRVRCYPEQAN